MMSTGCCTEVINHQIVLRKLILLHCMLTHLNLNNILEKQKNKRKKSFVIYPRVKTVPMTKITFLSRALSWFPEQIITFPFRNVCN